MTWMAAAAALVGLLGCGGAGPEPGPGLDPCGPPPAVHDWAGGETLAWTSDDGWCVRIERTSEMAPDELCKACPFALHRMVVASETAVVDETDEGALLYVPSHHNWADEARVEVDGTTYVVRFGPSFGGLGDVLEVWDGEDLAASMPLTPRALFVPDADNSATAQSTPRWGLPLR